MWRRADERLYDTTTGKEIPPEKLSGLTDKEREENLSRPPLTAAQVSALVDTAVKIQSQAIAVRQELRWWVAIFSGLLGVLLGAILTNQAERRTGRRFVPTPADKEVVVASFRRALTDPDKRDWEIDDVARASLNVAHEETAHALRVALSNPDPKLSEKAAALMGRLL